MPVSTALRPSIGAIGLSVERPSIHLDVQATTVNLVFGFSPARRLPVVVALLAGLIVLGVIVGHTHGAKPHANGVYTGTVYVENDAGHVTARLPISLTVNRTGQRVGRLRFPGGLPQGCPGHSPGRLVASTASAVLRNPSAFEINLPITGASGPIGILEVSGVFESLDRESGAVATRYSAEHLRSCDASGGYTAKAPTD
jgi:hypothetical protein